jgi:DNA-binding beta-propeller fold protein YncE
MNWRLIVVALVAVPVASTSSAGPGSVSPSLGSLVQSPGRTGCVVQVPRSVALVNRCGAARAIAYADEVAVSGDGRNVYVAGGHDIAVFARDRKMGALSQLRGQAGCVGERRGCRSGALNGATGLAVAPDGRHVYASSFHDTAFHDGDVAVFARAPRTGALRALRCESCRPSAQTHAYPTGLAITPDGGSVYLVSPTLTPIVQAFRPDADSGLLSPTVGRGGCVRRRDFDGCAAAVALPFEPVRIAVSPDSRHVYVASGWSEDVATTVFAFSRDRGTGRITPLQSPAGCVRPDRAPPCTTATGLLGHPIEITIAPDGQNVYVLSEGPGSAHRTVTIFKRNPATGTLSQERGRGACISGAKNSQCSTVTLIRRILGTDISDIAVSPRGQTVYVSNAAWPDGAAVIAAFRRGVNGALTLLPLPYRCVSSPSHTPCTRVTALPGEAALASSADGRNLYAAGGDRIAIFRPRR